MIIDLHCHSTASDGTLSPKELMLRAATMQVDCIALTDHDSTHGLDAAAATLKSLGGKKPTLIPGVEISCRWHQFEIHILGWNFDPEHLAIQALLKQQQESRSLRAQKIHEKLLKNGVSPGVLKDLPTTGVLTRAHFARALISGDLVNTMEEAFDRYLGKGNCAYVRPEWCTIEEAVEAIHLASNKEKGLIPAAGLAHPLAYGLKGKWLRRLINDFKAYGGDAIEAVSPRLSPDQRQWLVELTCESGLKGSIGSDFHRPGVWRELGKVDTLPDSIQPVWADWELAKQTPKETAS